MKAKSDVQAAQQQLDAAQKLLESRRNLYQEGALARSLVDEANVAYAQAKAQLETAKEHLQALESVGNEEQIQRPGRRWKPPGRNTSRPRRRWRIPKSAAPSAGSSPTARSIPATWPAPAQPLATVVDISTVVARANVPQVEAQAVKVGDAATIKLPNGSFEMPGKVTVVSPATDPSSTTVQVWVQADNPHEQLKPGASVRAEIVAATIAGATVVPSSAILPGEEGGTAVMTVSADNTAHRNPVTLGAREGDKVQIVSGVAPGEPRHHDRRAGPGRQGQSADRAGGRKGRGGEGRGRQGRGQEMSETVTPPPVAEPVPSHWTERHGKPVIFVILTLVAVGIYLALTIPVAVFPETNFPRIVVGVDNGVMPIDQMLVTVTRPIEEAVNTVQGLDHLWSITSRGSAEVDLFFSWKVDMYRTLELVNAALARVQPTLPPTAKIVANRLTFAAFPIMGYSLTSDTVPQTRIWEMATYDLKPRLNRMPGVSTVVVQGGQEPEFEIRPDPAKLVQTGVTIPNILDAIGRSNLIDSPGLIEMRHELFLSLVSGQTRTPEEISNIVDQDHAGGGSAARGRRGLGGAFGDAGVHGGDRQWQARGADEYLPPDGQQYRHGGQCRPRRDRANPQDPAAGHRPAAVLRPVRNRHTSPSTACAMRF